MGHAKTLQAAPLSPRRSTAPVRNPGDRARKIGSRPAYRRLCIHSDLRSELGGKDQFGVGAEELFDDLGTQRADTAKELLQRPRTSFDVWIVGRVTVAILEIRIALNPLLDRLEIERR